MEAYTGVVQVTPQRRIALQAMADHREETVGALIGYLVETLADQLLEESGWKPGMSGPTCYDYVRCLCAKHEAEEQARG